MTLTLRLNGEILTDRHVRLTEYQPLEIEVATAHGSGVQPDIILDGASIGSPEASVTEEGLLWRWTYRSESWCGRTTLTVLTGSAPIEVHVEARPDGSKYGEDEYERMIERIVAYGSQLPWGLAPALTDAREVGGARLGATHPVLIAHYLQPLLEQLERLLLDPVLSQRRETLVQPLRSAQVASGTLNWLASRPVRLKQARVGDRRVAVPQHLRRETFDHPANRYVVALIRRLRAVLHDTADALGRYSRGAFVDPPEQHRARHLAELTQRASMRLGAALRHPVLCALPAGEMTEGVVQIFADHPAYARFAKLARRLLDPGLELSDRSGLAASVRRSWDLFEIYCLYRMLQELEHVLGDSWTFERKPPVGHVLSGPAEGVCWRARHFSGLRWEFYYQQVFGRAANGPFSITTQRRPDFCLALFDGRRLQRWILLDAKYRTARSSINEALASMHVYRDSLSWRSSPSGDPRRADAGYLLVPDINEECGRYGRREFLDKWGIGLIAIDQPSLGDLLIRLTRGDTSP